MTATELYVIRHGRTMFNALQRAQGWCDTPLTSKGAQDIHYLGLGLSDTTFVEAVSSDSGRAIETMRLILGENKSKPPYSVDSRIREWCWGSLEGGYDSEMWGVLPRVLDFKTSEEMWDTEITFEDIAKAVLNADTAHWAEPYEQIRGRVLGGMEDIAYRIEKNGGGKGIIVSHGFTIAFLLNLIDPSQPVRVDLQNGSVTRLRYEKGEFTIEEIGSTAFIEAGRKISADFLA
ncbi:histidine phosphatase family protein [Enterococcus asini]|uniref:histidine phosphatase family protein n=1 Tax=Enterococcus asini TaxID=57732 RepID=UPI002890A502|nr:histidine phosphatase family protein [Enterococcus asini]MDT2757063.1 histidine phosphatase family protein [Enterococcus asini]